MKPTSFGVAGAAARARPADVPDELDQPPGSDDPLTGVRGPAVSRQVPGATASATPGLMPGGSGGALGQGPAAGISVPGASRPGPSGPATDTPTSYPGVSATAVKWGTASAVKSCGSFDQSAVQQAYGISSNNPVSYQAAVDYFNGFPLTDFPLPPTIRASVHAKKGFWGRKITTVFRDSGGVACQHVGRAKAVNMAEDDKVFGLIMPINDGPEVPMSLVMAQHKRIHIGRWQTGPAFWRQRAPYFYDGYNGDGLRAPA